MHHPHHHPHAHAYTSDRSSNPYGITMGTLRSTKSVPALAMQHDGCPVHGQELMRHPTGAYSVIHAPIYADRRMLAGNHSVVDLRSLPPLPPPLPPQMQPPSAMISNFEGKKLQSAIQLPLPQGMYPSSAQQARHLLMQHREQHQICSPLDVYGVTGTPDPSCCKGHLIVLWIILAVVTMGVISGIVLGVTMN